MTAGLIAGGFVATIAAIALVAETTRFLAGRVRRRWTR